jgi:predicted transcriptional regulator
MTQEALAHAAGTHATYVSRVESGKYNPRLTMLDRLLAALGKSWMDLARDTTAKRRRPSR